MRRVRLHPYAIEPSANTRALYVIGWDEEPISPLALGCGEPLFRDIDLPKLGYETSEHVPTEATTHLVLAKQ
jgi:hypothetical protein